MSALAGCEYFSFSQAKRISCVDALYHPFVEEGRLHYHSYLCSCCFTAVNNVQYVCCDQEPSSQREFSQHYEKDLTSLPVAKGIVCNLTSMRDALQSSTLPPLPPSSSPLCVPVQHQDPSTTFADEHFM